VNERTRAWLLFVGDGICLAGFVLAGLQTHDSAHPLVRFALTAGPLIGTWTIVGLGLRAFHFDLPVRLRSVWGRTLTTWLVAAPLALLLRALLLRSATVAVIFMLITLGLGGATLLLWRTLFVWVAGKAAQSPYGKIPPTKENPT